MKLLKLIIFIITLFTTSSLFGYERYLSIGSPDLDADAIFQINSTTKASKPCPSMTSGEKEALGSPTEGLCVWDSTNKKLYNYNGTAWSAIGGGGSGGVNVLPDASFETAITNVTANVGTIASESTNVYHAPDGKGLKITLAAQAADVEQCVTFTQWENVNAQVSCFIKSSLSSVELCSSNDVTDPLCVDYDASNDWKKVISSMVVDATGKMCWRVKSGTETGNIYVDECEIRELQPSVEAAIGAWTPYTPTFSDAITATDAWYWRRVGDSMEIQGRSSIASTGSASIFTISFPSGYEADANKINTTGSSVVGAGLFYDTSTTDKYLPGNASFYSSTAFFITAEGKAIIYGNELGSGDRVSIRATVPIVGWASSTQFLTQSYDWYVDANIGGANPNLGTSTVSTYTGVTNGSLSLTNNTTLNNVAIACAGTEEATIGDTTCSGNESVGITFDGWVGNVDVCATFSAYAITNASGTVTQTFKIVTTGNANQTLALDGHERSSNTQDDSGTFLVAQANPNRVCGKFSVSGKTTARIFYRQTIVATTSSSLILADGGTDRNIHWSVIPISGTMYANLAGLGSSYVNKTDHYTIKDKDYYSDIGVSVTGKTITLPDAGNNTNETFKIIHMISGFGSSVTIKGANAGQTVDGISGTVGRVLYSYKESLTLISDGTKWIKTGHFIPSEWETCTGVSGAFTTNADYYCKRRRVGDEIELQLMAYFNGANTQGGGYSFNTFPETMDTSKKHIAQDGKSMIGTGVVRDNSTGNVYTLIAITRTTTSAYMRRSGAEPTPALFSTSPFSLNTDDHIEAYITYPVSGWWK